MISLAPKNQAQSAYVSFDSTAKPLVPDYSNIDNWAAHPSKKDLGDKIPRPLCKYQTDLAEKADVLFFHPTIFTKMPENKYKWNASVQDEKMNKQVDKTTIKMQASIFNQAGRLFAPRYRQAHLRSFFEPNLKEGDKALALAYKDIKAAFLYYLEYENKGRPFILAGHSQGARHLKKLMQELVDGKALQKQLIAAYIVGWGVEKGTFKSIPLGNSPAETGCFMTWRTYDKGYVPNWIRQNDVCTNPLNWKADSTYAPYEENEGAVLYGFNTIRKKLMDAQVHGPVLWVGKPNMLFGKMFQQENYHVGDYNLFYVNVRNNAILRTRTYLEKQTKKSL